MTVVPAELLTQPGFLYFGVTSLVTPPFGGVSLGMTDDGIHIEPNLELRVVKGEERGTEGVKLVYEGAEVIVMVTLKQWNDETLQRAFPAGLTKVGGTTGERVVAIPGTLDLGTDIPGGRLLFAPTDLLRNKAFLAMNAKPSLTAAAVINSKLKDDTMFELVFRCQRDETIISSNAAYDFRVAGWGDITDLVLP